MKSLRFGVVVLGLLASALAGSAAASPIPYYFDLVSSRDRWPVSTFPGWLLWMASIVVAGCASGFSTPPVPSSLSWGWTSRWAALHSLCSMIRFLVRVLFPT